MLKVIFNSGTTVSFFSFSGTLSFLVPSQGIHLFITERVADSRGLPERREGDAAFARIPKSSRRLGTVQCQQKGINIHQRRS